jgi:hypothetical protein
MNLHIDKGFFFLYTSIVHASWTSNQWYQESHSYTLAVLRSVFCIQAQSSGILNGLEITSSIPAFKATSTCSLLTFAVTAMTGTCALTTPSLCNSLIFLTQVSPSMTISRCTKSVCVSHAVCISAKRTWHFPVH